MLYSLFNGFPLQLPRLKLLPVVAVFNWLADIAAVAAVATAAPEEDSAVAFTVMAVIFGVAASLSTTLTFCRHVTM